jgi:hypothetical protein
MNFIYFYRFLTFFSNSIVFWEGLVLSLIPTFPLPCSVYRIGFFFNLFVQGLIPWGLLFPLPSLQLLRGDTQFPVHADVMSVLHKSTFHRDGIFPE